MDYKTFIASRDRNWWRSYYGTAVKTTEGILKRPLTLRERILIVRLLHQRRDSGQLGSSGVLGMHISLVIEKPDIWKPIWFREEGKE